MLFSIPYCATQSFIVRYTETRNLPVTVSLVLSYLCCSPSDPALHYAGSF